MCKAVREGKADVGATFAAEPRGTWWPAAVKRARGDFKVLASTGNLPNEVIAARDFFPPTRINDVIATFDWIVRGEEGAGDLPASMVGRGGGRGLRAGVRTACG